MHFLPFPILHKNAMQNKSDSLQKVEFMIDKRCGI